MLNGKHRFNWRTRKIHRKEEEKVRSTKTLGLAALTAMVVMAFVGVPAASADTGTIVVCENSKLECESPLVTEIVKLKKGEEIIGEDTVSQIHGTAVKPNLLSSLGTVECEKSLANITVLNELAASLTGHVTELSFTGNCHLGGTECKVTTELLGDMSFTHGKEPLEALAKSTGGTEVRVKCGSFINCLYGGEPTLKAHSDKEGKTELLTNETGLTGKGFLCPSTAKWDAVYKASGTMYIES